MGIAAISGTALYLYNVEDGFKYSKVFNNPQTFKT